MDGFAAVIKPPGVTSHDLVHLLRKTWGDTLGHAGTLDPDAVGVLVVARGQAGKLLQWLSLEPKIYWGCLSVGIATDTEDAAGHVVAESRPPWPPPPAWERAARALRGVGCEVPPKVSAKKQAGTRGYEAWRAGRPLWLPPRPRVVEDLAVESVDGRTVTFRATVGRGTYVRALVRDWAEAVGHAGHLTALIRVAVGPFDIRDAATPDEARGGRVRWRGWREVWPHAVVPIDAARARQVGQGRWPADFVVSGRGPWALADPSGRLTAVAVAPGRFGRVFSVPWI
jgi:tRNA pseudouridine55 synthase